MMNKADINRARLNRHRRVRGKITGTAERPRLNVFHSAKNIYAQIIDDVVGVTLAAASTLDKELIGDGGNKEAVRQVGELIARRATKRGIIEIVFDRGGYIFHGRAKELVESVRKGGLKF